MNSFNTVILGETASSQGNPLFTLAFLGLMMGALYFFMIRPQQKRQREAATFSTRLAAGDRVITNAGIFGRVTAVEDDCVHLEIDRDVVIKVLKSAVARSQDEPETPQRSGRQADKSSGPLGLTKKSDKNTESQSD